ncbi:MAG: alpha/beta hydrolase [bacterium]
MEQPVYKHYDQPMLDSQYNLRVRHPDFQEHFDWFDRESAATREEMECRLDVAYGDTAQQTLDVFPAAAPNSPVQVFIHGGYWQAMDKSSFSFPARSFVPAGAAFVSINYGLAPNAGMDEIVEQCRRAMAWCHANAASFNGDVERMYISGHSAGGHLIAMMVCTDWAAFDGMPENPIKGGCAISGLFDLEPVRLCYLNEVLAMDAPTARRNSPLLNIPKKGIPFIAAVGGAETDEFRRQNGMLATAWRARGFPCEEMRVPNLNHFEIMRELNDPGSRLSQAILGQMGL